MAEERAFPTTLWLPFNKNKNTKKHVCAVTLYINLFVRAYTCARTTTSGEVLCHGPDKTYGHVPNSCQTVRNTSKVSGRGLEKRCKPSSPRNGDKLHLKSGEAVYYHVQESTRIHAKKTRMAFVADRHKTLKLSTQVLDLPSCVSMFFTAAESWLFCDFNQTCKSLETGHNARVPSTAEVSRKSFSPKAIASKSPNMYPYLPAQSLAKPCC